MFDADNVWMAEMHYGGGYVQHYDDASWSRQTERNSGAIHSVSAPDGNNVWTVGGYIDNPAILYYDGRSWSRQASPASHRLRSVSACRRLGNMERYCILTADPGAIKHLRPLKNCRLSGVSAYDTDSVWAVGYVPGNTSLVPCWYVTCTC